MPPYPPEMRIKKRMVFEVVHPVHVHTMAVASIVNVLDYGYFEARIEPDPPGVPLTFCLHITSPWIVPCGFAGKHDLPLILPRGTNKESFNWDSYLQTPGVKYLDLSPLPAVCIMYLGMVPSSLNIIICLIVYMSLI
jgi:hypothetical protein